jgi:hypothetical protein
MSIKMVNIGMAGCGQYSVQDDGRTIGEIRRTNKASYVDADGHAWPVSVVVWVAENRSGNVVGVGRTRDEAMSVLTGIRRPAVIDGVVQ